jgi:hypothetical protein
MTRAQVRLKENIAGENSVGLKDVHVATELVVLHAVHQSPSITPSKRVGVQEVTESLSVATSAPHTTICTINSDENCKTGAKGAASLGKTFEDKNISRVVDEKTKVRATKNGRKPLATISQNIPL